MTFAALSDAIAAATDEMSVEVGSTPEQVLEAQRLRYRVYCEERGFEPGENGLVQDEFDASSRHILVCSKANGMVYGTVRIVLAPADSSHDSFPMNQVCESFVLAPLPTAATGEISRFALTRDRLGIRSSTETPTARRLL